MKKTLSLLLLLTLLLSVFSAHAAQLPPFQPGKKANDLVLILSSGEEITVHDRLSGKKAVLVSTYSAALEEVHETLSADIAFFSVDGSDASAIPVVSLKQTESLLVSAPFFMLIDRNGVICCVTAEAVPSADSLEALLKPYLAEDYAASLICGSTPFTAASAPLPSAAEYRIHVADTAGNPISGAMVQICTTDLCQVAFTDAQGLALHTGAPYPYEVHLLRAVGFQADGTAYVMPAEGGSLVIELTAE